MSDEKKPSKIMSTQEIGELFAISSQRIKTMYPMSQQKPMIKRIKMSEPYSLYRTAINSLQFLMYDDRVRKIEPKRDIYAPKIILDEFTNQKLADLTARERETYASAVYATFADRSDKRVEQQIKEQSVRYNQ